MEFNLNTLPKSLLIIFLLALVVSGCTSVSDIDLADSDKSNSFNTTPHRPLFQGSDFFIDTVVKNNRLSPTEAEEIESIVDSLVRSLISSLIFTRYKYFFSPLQEEEARRELFLVEFNSFGVPTYIYVREPYERVLGIESDLLTHSTSGLKIPHVYTESCLRNDMRFTQDLLRFIQPVLVTSVPTVGVPGEDFFLATTNINRSNLSVSRITYGSYLGDNWVGYENTVFKCRLDLGFSAEKALKAWGELRWIGT